RGQYVNSGGGLTTSSRYHRSARGLSGWRVILFCPGETPEPPVFVVDATATFSGQVFKATRVARSESLASSIRLAGSYRVTARGRAPTAVSPSMAEKLIATNVSGPPPTGGAIPVSGAAPASEGLGSTRALRLCTQASSPGATQL